MIEQLREQLAQMKESKQLAQVARVSGLAERTIYRIANGDSKDSRLSTLTRVLAAIQVVKAKETAVRC